MSGTHNDVQISYNDNKEYLNKPGLRYYHILTKDSSGGGGGNASVYTIHVLNIDDEHNTFTYGEPFDDIIYALNDGKILRMVKNDSSILTISTDYSYHQNNDGDDIIFEFTESDSSSSTTNFLYFKISSSETDGEWWTSSSSGGSIIVPSDGIDYLDASYLRVKVDASLMRFDSSRNITIKYDGSTLTKNSNGLSVKCDGDGVIDKNSNGLHVKIDDTLSVEQNKLHANMHIMITHQQLYEYKMNHDLIPGAQYCITDYKCVVNPDLSDVTSIMKSFGIIVTADDVDKLNENAKAVCCDDRYFESFDLSKWELKYSIENNDSLFEWASIEDGCGVIYYMKDEWGNEAPYDFKNILFDGKFTFGGGATDMSLSGNCHDNIIKPSNYNDVYMLPRVIFGEKCSNNIVGNDCIASTFGENCVGNVLMCRNQKITLSDNCSFNIIESDCSDILLDAECNHNTFKSGINNIVVKSSIVGVIEMFVFESIKNSNSRLITIDTSSTNTCGLHVICDVNNINSNFVVVPNYSLGKFEFKPSDIYLQP